MVSLQAVLTIFRGSSLLGIFAFDAPQLHLLMHFIWQVVCNMASDLERDKRWMEMDFFFFWFFPLFYFYFFMNTGEYI